MSKRTPDRMLKDLLAVIHRDGGHHTTEVGLDRSFDDAVLIVAKTRMDLQELERTFQLINNRELQRTAVHPIGCICEACSVVRARDQRRDR